MIGFAPKQPVASNNTGVAVFMAATRCALSDFQRIICLNLEAARFALIEGRLSCTDALSVNNPEEFVIRHLKTIQPAIESMLSYRG